jgi:hypothetical protein
MGDHCGKSKMLQPREYVDPSLVDPNSNAYDGLPDSFKNKLDRGSRIVSDVRLYCDHLVALYMWI